MEERLQKVLANAGIASRRKAEAMIQAGRVRVNNQVITALGTRVNPMQDVIEVDGRRIQTEQPQVYIMLNKPPGYVTTVRDPHGRPTVLDLVDVKGRIYPVGRLDFESEGLLLLTNDGELANRLTHPRFEHEREYSVQAEGRVTREDVERLAQGILLEEENVKVSAEARVVRLEHGMTWLRITLREGRKRQLRRMLDAIGHPVRRLIRIRMGPLELGNLPVGRWRELTKQEVQLLKRATAETAKSPSPGSGRQKQKPGTPGADAARRSSRNRQRKSPDRRTS